MSVHLGMPTVRPLPAADPADPLRWGPTFPDAAHETLQDGQLRANLRRATHTIRDKRLAVTAELSDWEDLRAAGSGVKQQVMATLPDLLEQLEASVTARGGVVHWARDAAEANRIVTDLVRAADAHEVVKVKSMATQEIGLNEHLAAAGIEATETDLAELIVQLAGDMPSHILVPAIHRNRDQIRDIFTGSMGDAPAGLTSEPADLAAAARAHLRARFLRADVAISGANLAVADTGTVAVVESEGNGRMCLTLPRVLITVMGIEKVLPTFTDLEVFMQLLPRSSTGERMNPYTTFWTGVTPGDGPQEFHLVLLDNGRTRALADEIGRTALHCIRCSACLNVCPVYERTGGHAYGSVYPGPIGAILTPQLLGVGAEGGLDPHDPAATLPFASSLCGACYDACPVKIDIPTALVHLRDQAQHPQGRRARPTGWSVGLGLAALSMRSGTVFRWAGRAVPLARRLLPRRVRRLPFPGSLWTSSRDLPVLPRQTFRDWFEQRPEPGAAGGQVADRQGTGGTGGTRADGEEQP
ncbi:lactate utilization protein B [Cellulomonas marina]|uniref:L-lactate dehydrogenase complex protein LldF n=1 Tax=Cellulomonas marina TaxID=988821 RepID=A0A1I1AD18_9CELL|nr:lactate utilization protein B [Cellulomonas marina]GIG29726.1 iron-sulfur cluster-binding protein [Cellulomonas marina]SFB35877.1 L-lactate dehydrogenase complex protein LldF [Cellulomonas marina]